MKTLLAMTALAALTLGGSAAVAGTINLEKPPGSVCRGTTEADLITCRLTTKADDIAQSACASSAMGATT